MAFSTVPTSLYTWMSTLNTGHRLGVYACGFLVLVTFTIITLFIDWRYFPEVPKHVRAMFENGKRPVRPKQTPTDAQWQPVTPTSDAYVYSAYFDRKFSDRVRIIGVIKTAMLQGNELYCVFWYGGASEERPKLVGARVVDMKATHDKLTMVVFLCPISENGVDRERQYVFRSNVPSEVSLVDVHTLHRPLNVLVVHKKIRNTPRYNLTACVAPMFNPTVNKSLIEWIETNKLLGVELFTVYVHRISDRDLKILKYYESKKIVEVMNWTMSSSNDEQFHRPSTKHIDLHGQTAAANECVYRNKGRALLTMQTDIDELILPQKQEDFTILDMIRRLPHENVYCFRHVFLPKVNQSVSLDVHPRYKFDIKMVDRFERSKQIWKPRLRSKIIYKPDEVVAMGTHNTFEPDEKFEHVVDTDIGMLHHYRNPTNIPDKDVPTVTTNVTMKYLATLLYNINLTLTALGKFSF